MACNICGSSFHEIPTLGCIKWKRRVWPIEYRGTHYGWTCPACGKGNAPDVKGCIHCATTGNGDLWASGKLSVVKVDMR